MKEERGLVLSEKKGRAIVLTPEGEFLEVASDGRGVGEETVFHRPGWKRRLYAALALAAAFLLVASFFLYSWCSPAPAAYISLDLNPSLELGVNREGKVVALHPYDEEGRKLLAGAGIKGLPLKQVLGILFERACSFGFLRSGSGGVVLVAVVQTEPVLALQEVASWVEEELTRDQVEAKVVVLDLPLAFGKEARRADLSPGRYALLRGVALWKGKEPKVAEIKCVRLRQLEERYGVGVEELLRGEGREVVVKKMKQETGSGGAKKGGGGIKREEGSHPLKGRSESKRGKISSDDTSARHHPFETFPHSDGGHNSSQSSHLPLRAKPQPPGAGPAGENPGGSSCP
ncbi:anti-sigma factor domain-containing protein [Ammonifex thiophilus]|uniref:anti-sigma factor domain-containing protein n=1 Tax=Ammonifex thiophilus TaxID=444093 RepID=UPI001F0C1BD0|nr:anti-sigma factor domain-containing protein [Ammonifex thiophilus]